MMLPQYKVDDIKGLIAELVHDSLGLFDNDHPIQLDDDEVRKFCSDVALVLNGEVYDSE